MSIRMLHTLNWKAYDAGARLSYKVIATIWRSFHRKLERWFGALQASTSYRRIGRLTTVEIPDQLSVTLVFPI